MEKIGRCVATAVILVAGLVGCDTYFNLTQPLDEQISIALVNKTPYRAVFTIGAFDPFDQNTIPDFQQFRLEGDSVDFFQNDCRRAVAVGSQRLIDLINDSGQNVADADALVVGVNFSGAAANDPEAAQPTEGTAESIEVFHGVDYPCGALLIFTFVQDADAPGGFKVEFGVIF